MKKPVVITVIALVFVVGIFAYLNKQSLGDKLQDQKNAVMSIKHDGKEEKIDFTFLKSVGEETFEANLKKNGKAAVKHEYTGVDLKKLLAAKKISASGKTTLTATAVDGYSSAVNMDEMEKGSNVYIVYKVDGELLKSSEAGGDGPYMMVIRGDQFSQRWCKLLVGVELN